MDSRRLNLVGQPAFRLQFHDVSVRRPERETLRHGCLNLSTFDACELERLRGFLFLSVRRKRLFQHAALPNLESRVEQRSLAQCRLSPILSAQEYRRLRR
jgi:hypothetical protein